MRGDCFRCVAFESHRCRNQWIGNKPCPDGLQFEEYTGSNVRQCLCATVEEFQDGYIHCPIIDEIGCEECMKRFGDGSNFWHDESQNYERKPKWREAEEVAKKKSKEPIPREQMEKLLAELKRNFEHWEYLYNYGGQDPFHEDGSNLNLTRIHIIHNKKQVKELCEANSLELPELYHRELPPEVDSRYMARADEIRKNAVKILDRYKTDVNYQYLLTNVDKLNKKQLDNTCINNVINYAKGLGMAMEKDILVDMRQHEKNPDRYIKSFSECAEKVKSILGDDNQNCIDLCECCENCGHSEGWGESVEYIKCAENGKRKDVRKKQVACANYIPVSDDVDDEPEGDLEEQLDELLKEGDAEDKSAADKELLSSLIGKKIRTHYDTGGIVFNVSGPHNAYGPGSWSINYTEDGKKRKNFSIINSIKVENGVITCDGKPLQIIDQGEQTYIYRGLA
jgi:hypothetical protein